MSLTVRGDEPSKFQLLKYLIGNDCREIYNTLRFEKEEKDRILKMALNLFDNYCRPKKKKLWSDSDSTKGYKRQVKQLKRISPNRKR